MTQTAVAVVIDGQHVAVVFVRLVAMRAFELQELARVGDRHACRIQMLHVIEPDRSWILWVVPERELRMEAACKPAYVAKAPIGIARFACIDVLLQVCM